MVLQRGLVRLHGHMQKAQVKASSLEVALQDCSSTMGSKEEEVRCVVADLYVEPGFVPCGLVDGCVY